MVVAVVTLAIADGEARAESDAADQQGGHHGGRDPQRE
jgi:hypothetical protein